MSRELPPHDLEAESSVIGAALLRPSDIIDKIKGFLDPSDFYKPVNCSTWAAILELHEHGAPIDVITVSNHLGGERTLELLAGYQNAVPSISTAPRYAAIVVEASRRRRLVHHLAEITARCYTETADQILADVMPNEYLIGRRDGEVQGLFSMEDFLVHAVPTDLATEWLVPHIFRPLWRCVVVAAEGVGKGTLMRSIGLHVAAGRDPWNPIHRIPERRILYVDAENPTTTILHQIRISNLNVDLAAEVEDRFFLWHREGGVDLRQRRMRAEFEAVLQRSRPEIVFAGPFYKLFRRKSNEDLEQSTVEFLEVLDDFRVRYNFALMLEAHAPKGQHGYRDLNPRGSGALMGWPEFGITLEAEGESDPGDDLLTLKIGRFRRDREPSDWPTSITRGQIGQRFAWQARWANGRNRLHWPY